MYLIEYPKAYTLLYHTHLSILIELINLSEKEYSIHALIEIVEQTVAAESYSVMKENETNVIQLALDLLAKDFNNGEDEVCEENGSNEMAEVEEYDSAEFD